MMQSPLPNGSLLQNRYRTIQVLGQGGFGRTYLAEDGGRFKERCVLKELSPSTSSEYAVTKSRELFQREAEILYQLQHPQIPKFRATFEEDRRFFLVQDYVDGNTYRALLREYQNQGRNFSEAEVTELMRQLLPVLDYVHAQGIIHRDISPDNVIRRTVDGVPILIDFGVVKDLATRIQSPETLEQGTPQGTTVGKLGYAPAEQLQTGRAYPSSDLYALAATAVELLTGRDPGQLFDEHQLVWTWQQSVSVSPGLAQVLNRMLNTRPGDRYQSAQEALQDLSPGTAASGVSAIPTVAVGRPAPGTIPPEPPRTEAGRSIPSASSPSIWDNPTTVILAGGTLAVLVGLSAWTLARGLFNSDEPVSPTPTATISPTTAPTPTVSEERLNLSPGRSLQVQRSLKANETLNYRFSGNAGQSLNANLTGEGVLMTVLTPNGSPAPGRSQRVSSWQGFLPETGVYTLQLQLIKGLAQSDYKLEAELLNPEPVPIP
ncbi:MAG: serine/threonine-protein kinase, partial [Geitlerinemataceae cyanobacterium]